MSPYNYDDEVTSQFTFSPEKSVTVYDSTLRKMFLTPGVEVSAEDAVAVAVKLDEAGVTTAFIHVDWSPRQNVKSLHEYRTCERISEHGLKLRVILSTSRLRADDWRNALDQLADSGASCVEASLPITTEHRMGGFTPVEAAERFRGAVEYGKTLGFEVIPAFPDPARTSFSLVKEALNAYAENGASQLNLYDSYSSLSPEGMGFFIKKVRQNLARNLPIMVHVHNDFGLGTACAVAAATSGACPDVAVNGISYRSGFAAMEEVVVALEVLYGVSTGIRLDKLPELSDLVARKMGMKNHPYKAVVGNTSFLLNLESWLVEAFREGPDRFPPVGSCYSPRVVGRNAELAWTRLALGGDALGAKLNAMGLKYTDADVDRILRSIELNLQKKRKYPRWLRDVEVERLCKEALNS